MSTLVADTSLAAIPLNSNFSSSFSANQFQLFSFTLPSEENVVLTSLGIAGIHNLTLYNSAGHEFLSNSSILSAVQLANFGGSQSFALRLSPDTYYFSLKPSVSGTLTVNLKASSTSITAANAAVTTSFTPVFDTLFSVSSTVSSSELSALQISVNTLTADKATLQTQLASAHSDADYQTVVSARDTALADKTAALNQVTTLATEKAQVLADKATVEAARDTALADKATALAQVATLTAENQDLSAGNSTAVIQISSLFAQKAQLLSDKSIVEAARDAAIADKLTAETARDVAIADKAAGLQGVVSNLDGVSLAAGVVTFSKTKADYTAFDFDKTINANSLANKIVTGVNATKVTAGDGNDTVTAGVGNDTIDGGKGDDSIAAGQGNNVLTSGAGSDSITAGAGNDKIDAGDDNDIINA
ncbi:MAG: hypothetical protein PHC99_05385, partial [Methylococcales bacterium]|nr:hypothetical protein [Methylococcales bacterium]